MLLGEINYSTIVYYSPGKHWMDKEKDGMLWLAIGKAKAALKNMKSHEHKRRFFTEWKPTLSYAWDSAPHIKVRQIRLVECEVTIGNIVEKI